MNVIFRAIVISALLLAKIVVAQTVAPANDDFGGAEPVSPGKTSITVNLTASTLEPGETAKPDQVGSVWYKWIPSSSGIARFSNDVIYPLPTPTAASFSPALSDESIFYPWGGVTGTTVTGVIITQIGGTIINFGYERWWGRLVLYRGVSLDHLTPIELGPSAEFQVQTGEQITICVEVYKSGPHSEFDIFGYDSLPTVFYLDLAPPLTNDSFDSSLSISDSSAGYMEGHLLGATREPGEPNLAGDSFSGGSVWFHYTAAIYGTVTLTPSTPVGFAVFSGADLANLQLVTQSAGPAASFLGEEGKHYHVAVYQGASDAAGFNFGLTAPKYRLYETNLDGLMPGTGGFPHFYGLRGATILFYAKTAAGWKPVEIEPIVNEAADLVIRPSEAIDGQVRVITVDETLPSPHVTVRNARGVWVADLIGVPGQTCAVSSSVDLVNWSTPRLLTLDSRSRVLESFSATAPTIFYRVTQSYPAPPPTSGYSGGGGVVNQMLVYPPFVGPVTTPPVPAVPSGN